MKIINEAWEYNIDGYPIGKITVPFEYVVNVPLWIEPLPYDIEGITPPPKITMEILIPPSPIDKLEAQLKEANKLLTSPIYDGDKEKCRFCGVELPRHYSECELLTYLLKYGLEADER